MNIVRFEVPDEFVNAMLELYRSKQNHPAYNQTISTNYTIRKYNFSSAKVEDYVDDLYKLIFSDTSILTHKGNIFEHDYPYVPHTETWDMENQYNVTILLKSDDDTSMIVFDQYVDRSFKPLKWIGESGPMDMYKKQKNDKVFYMPVTTDRICDTLDVQNCTGKPVDMEFYKSLQHFDTCSQLYFFGTSGKEYTIRKNQGIIFPSNHIHAGGKIHTSKISVLNIIKHGYDNVCQYLKVPYEILDYDQTQ